MFVYLNEQKHLESFREICIIVFPFSHSQCAVGRGLNVNKEFLVENMWETSMINQCISSANLAHSRYVQYLDEKKEQTVSSKRAEHRKLITKEINDIKKRKKDVQSCIVSLNEDIENLSIKYEESNVMVLLVKENEFKHNVKGKKVLK